MSYPDTDLETDAVDPFYGGQPITAFGGLAIRWIANVLKFLSQAHLDYNRIGWRTIVATCEDASSAGDVAVMTLGAPTAAGAPRVRRYAAALANPIFLGVFERGCSAGAKGRIATHGMLAKSITGLSTAAAYAALTADTTTHRLKLAGGGDPIVGYQDLNGNVLITGYGTQL